MSEAPSAPQSAAPSAPQSAAPSAPQSALFPAPADMLTREDIIDIQHRIKAAQESSAGGSSGASMFSADAAGGGAAPQSALFPAPADMLTQGDIIDIQTRIEAAQESSAGGSSGASMFSADAAGGGAALQQPVPHCGVFLGIEKLLNPRNIKQPSKILTLERRERAGAQSYNIFIPESYEVRTDFKSNGVNVVYLSNGFFVPFGPTWGNTSQADIENLITWAADLLRRLEAESYAQGVSDCTGQALVFTNEFVKILSPIPSPGIRAYQHACMGPDGNPTMKHALNSDVLLNAIEKDSLFTYITLYSPSLSTPIFGEDGFNAINTLEHFYNFMLFLWNNHLIIPNSKFILNNQWEVFDSAGNKKKSAHAQLFACYIDENTNNFVLLLLDTQIPSATLVDFTGAAIKPEVAQKNIIKGRGEGRNFQEALKALCINLLGYTFWTVSRSFSIICRIPKIAEINKIRSQLDIIKQSIGICQQEAVKVQVGKELANARQSTVSSFGLQISERSGIELISSKFNPNLAKQQTEQALNNINSRSNVLHQQARDALQVCFPSVENNGATVNNNPLNVPNMNWHILKTKKKPLDRHGGRGGDTDELLGLLGTRDECDRSNPVCGIYSVCKRKSLMLKNVCKVLMGRSIIREMYRGRRIFFLGVRLGTKKRPQDPKEIPDLTSINIAAIKCYMQCGFSFRRVEEGSESYWPENEAQRRDILKIKDPLRFKEYITTKLKIKGWWSLNPGTELLPAENSGGSSQVSRENVIYGNMYLTFTKPYVLPDAQYALPPAIGSAYFYNELQKILEFHLTTNKLPYIDRFASPFAPATGASSVTRSENTKSVLINFLNNTLGAFISPDKESIISGITNAADDDIPKIIYLLQYSTHQILRLNYSGGKKKKTSRKKKNTRRKNKKKSKRKKKKTRGKNKRKKRIKTKRKKRKTRKNRRKNRRRK